MGFDQVLNFPQKLSSAKSNMIWRWYVNKLVSLTQVSSRAEQTRLFI